MKEKERKVIEREKQLNLIKTVEEIKHNLTHPKKDISMLAAFHKMTRKGLTEEVFEDLLGERNLLIRLERYGENSTFWKRTEKFKYEASSTESKRPSQAGLRSKVKCYEYEKTI